MAIIICTLTSCTTQQEPPKTSPTCFNARVIVTADDGAGNLVAPGVPVDVVVRSKYGRVLQAVKSDSEGKASLEMCWSDDDPAWQVEATLRLEPQFVGTLASFFNYTDTYCLTLPQRIGGHCGEWGSGPNKLLSGAKVPRRE
jgi:hypothetical protein